MDDASLLAASARASPRPVEGSAVAAPSRSEQQGGDRAVASAGRQRGLARLWAAAITCGRKGRQDMPAMGTCYRWALAGRGREEGASEKLWSGRGHEEETDGEHWPAEAPWGMARDGGTMGS